MLLRHVKLRIVKDFVDIIILNRLNSVPSSGYDITVYIHEKHEFFISTSNIYSTLYSLERKGFVKGDLTSRKRLYYLTQNGLNYIENVLNNRDDILNLIEKILRSS